MNEQRVKVVVHNYKKAAQKANARINRVEEVLADACEDHNCEIKQDGDRHYIQTEVDGFTFTRDL